MPPNDGYRDANAGPFNGLVYFAVVAIGCGYIVFSKLQAFSAFYVTSVPILVMIGYASLLAFSRLFRLRDDQSGDNLYYMGFLFTLTSLAVSLYQFSDTGSAEQIVQNFGVAIASTISGIALRIFFNQMRRDPVEIEQTARLELAEASRRVKRELDSTVLEFSYFRRATQQSISDALDEVNGLLADAKDRLVGQLDDFASRTREPLDRAARRSGQTVDDLNVQITTTLGSAVGQISDAAHELSKGAAAITSAVNGMMSELDAMQTPDQALEHKLAPMVEGLSRAIDAFTRGAEAQARAVDASLEQNQILLNGITVLLSEIKNGEKSRPGPTPDPDSRRATRSRATAHTAELGVQTSLWNEPDADGDGS